MLYVGDAKEPSSLRFFLALPRIAFFGKKSAYRGYVNEKPVDQPLSGKDIPTITELVCISVVLSSTSSTPACCRGPYFSPGGGSADGPKESFSAAVRTVIGIDPLRFLILRLVLHKGSVTAAISTLFC
jgi:hypothetical protein